MRPIRISKRVRTCPNNNNCMADVRTAYWIAPVRSESKTVFRNNTWRKTSMTSFHFSSNLCDRNRSKQAQLPHENKLSAYSKWQWIMYPASFSAQHHGNKSTIVMGTYQTYYYTVPQTLVSKISWCLVSILEKCERTFRKFCIHEALCGHLWAISS